jgi:hypothetical protein
VLADAAKARVPAVPMPTECGLKLMARFDGDRWRFGR